MAERDGNLCPRAQISKVRRAAVIMGVALATTVALVELDVARPWRFAVVVLFLAAFLELVQGFTGTCVFSAARGVRVTDEGVEAVANPADRSRIRKRARQVFAVAAASAVSATVLVLVLS
jgi:hypothetical protein